MDSIIDQFDAADPDATRERPREFDLELDPPIMFEKKRFERLHLQEPTALQIQRAEYELVSGSSFHHLRKYQIALIAQVSATPREVIEKIRITELGEAWNFIQPFTPLYRQTGESLWRTLPAGGAGDRSTPGT